jgi:hypothetical protein
MRRLAQVISRPLGGEQGVVVEARRREQLWSFGERSHAEPDHALAVVPDEVELL